MAHFEKYTQAQSRQVLQHDARKYSDGRDHIDHEKTVENYDLQGRPDPWQFVKDQIKASKDSGGRVNTRTVSLVSCVVTLPQEYKGDPDLFFDACKHYLDTIFGEENCVSAWVHKDEKQPHLHYKCTPIVRDGDRLQFNAKKLLSRTFLQKFHKDLDNYLESFFGARTGVVNGATTHGNQTIQQLKKLSETKKKVAKAQAKLDDINNKTAVAVNELQDLLRLIQQAEKKLADIKKKIHEIEGEDFSPTFNPAEIDR